MTTGEAGLDRMAATRRNGQAPSVSNLASRRVLRPQPEGEQLTRPQIACLLRITELAGSAADPAAVAAEALDLFASIVPCVAASVSAWNLLEHRHMTIASSGYLPCVLERVNSWLDERGHGDTSVLAADRGPFPQRVSPRGTSHSSWPREMLISAGVDDGVMVRLYTTDGRYTGTLHFHLKSRELPTHRTSEALLMIPSALAATTDWLRAASAVARSLEPDAAVAIVTAQADVVEVPGRQPGMHLAQSAPLVQTVADLLHASTRTSRFVWLDGVKQWHHVRIERLCPEAVVFEREIQPPRQLTCRELDVLTLLAEGHSNREIAALLVVARGTVATHVEHVLEKLKCASRTAAAARAVDEGLLRRPLALPGLGARGASVRPRVLHG